MIHGFFDRARPPHPYVTLSVFVPRIAEQWVTIDFVVDTGASRTCIHPLDAVRRLGVSPETLAAPAQWRQQVDSGGVGGRARYFVEDAAYGFHHDGGKTERIIGEIQIAELTNANQWLPSLLGWDLLQHFQLVTHGGDQTITLDRI